MHKLVVPVLLALTAGVGAVVGVEKVVGPSLYYESAITFHLTPDEQSAVDVAIAQRLGENCELTSMVKQPVSLDGTPTDVVTVQAACKVPIDSVADAPEGVVIRER